MTGPIHSCDHVATVVGIDGDLEGQTTCDADPRVSQPLAFGQPDAEPYTYILLVGGSLLLPSIMR